MSAHTTKIKKRRAGLKYFSVGLMAGALFGLYLWSLYNQLTQAFFHEDQFVPTRIYSDVTRISPDQPLELIEHRLKELGYTAEKTRPNPEAELQFTLHPMDYPQYLIPANHPTLQVNKQNPIEIHLQFDAHSKLKTILMGTTPVPDLYLEPEIVATLTGTLAGEESSATIRSSLAFSDVPAPIWKAIIAVEDQHFLEHPGLDPKGILRAIWVNLRTFSFAQGGSTITQQLVKNLMARRSKNIFRKINELFLALLLESRFEKEQILERYLNEVYLGQVGNLEIHGIAQGAQYFFGKQLEQLNLAEIALMAGLIRGPGYYSPYKYRERAIERQHLVLKKMVETGQIADQEAKEAEKLPIRLATPQSVTTKAPFFTDYVKAALMQELKGKLSERDILRAGFKVYTTLDVPLNAQAQLAVTQGIDTIEKRLKLQSGLRLEGALAAVDHSNGHIKALIGGKNYSKSNFNRILNMKRQVGSTFKPFVYLAAFEKGRDPNDIPYGPAHPAEDAPWTLTFDQGKQQWSPKNYEKKHRGWVSYRTALAHSINTIAARLGNEVGIRSVIHTAQALGIQSTLPEVPSLSLGSAELSPIELLQAYATIANHGTQESLTVLRGVQNQDGSEYRRFTHDSHLAVAVGSADLLTDTLQSVFIEGTARNAKKLGLDRPLAGKTGTTSQYRDAWLAGYSPELTCVVWVGMDQMIDVHAPKMNLTGAESALPIWTQFMKQALIGITPHPFPTSEALIPITADLYTGQEAKSDCKTHVATEPYIKGIEPKEKTCENHWKSI